MILVTGALGFIGSHTTRALLDQGESCLLTQHRAARRPAFLAAHVGRSAVVERVDCTDEAAVLDLGQRHHITGIVHLAAAPIGVHGPVEELQRNIVSLLNLLRAAQAWGVPRITVASTIGVYAGSSIRPFREDTPLPMHGFFPIPASKKVAEIVGSTVAAADDTLEVVFARIGAIWGPLGPPGSPFFSLPQLVHAAARGDALPQAFAEDGGDLFYAPDCGRAIALLHTAPRLNHTTYNVGSGRVTTNDDVVEAIKVVVPEVKADLAAGNSPDNPMGSAYLDTTRLREDTGFQPDYDLRGGVADYVSWLRSGQER